MFYSFKEFPELLILFNYKVWKDVIYSKIQFYFNFYQALWKYLNSFHYTIQFKKK
jgi:hypothetical protein